ncbi:hypothetical protein DOY81_001911, partial [Sarcophaga bullata]
MLNFPLTPGDKYEGRCAEIYITEKQFLVYHCSVCDEIYATFNDLLSHINKDHYENTKEYQEGEATSSVATTTSNLQHPNENQFIIKELKITNNDLAYCNGLKKEETNKNPALKVHDNATVVLDNKNTPQRKKPRMVSSILKYAAMNRTKLNVLIRDQLKNQEESKYVCGQCGFAFKEKHNLRSHLLRHSNQKNFSCSLCLKKFFTKSELRLHEYRHKAERPYVCKHCGMGFLSANSLGQHLRNLHSQQLLKECEQENQLTTQNQHHEDNDLKLNGQTNTTFYSCGYCNLKFDKNHDLKTHCRKQHDCNKAFAKDVNKIHSSEESKLSLIESVDEYELVQTLTDLE